MRRNIIDEIKSIQDRIEFNSSFFYINELDKIERAFKQLEVNDSEEFLKYIPISTIACFEAFFRSTIKELIDFGKPYNDNALNFNQSKNVKFDFHIINAIQMKAVTVGEFISHILPCNNFDDINSNMSTLIGIDFIFELKKYERESIFEQVKLNNKIFIENADVIISDIKRTFELRHIFCHEFATNIKVNKTEIFRCFENCKIFLHQVSDFIHFVMYKNHYETQADMNLKAYEDFNEADDKLKKIIMIIKEASKKYDVIPIDDKLFDKSIVDWISYRDSRAIHSAYSCEGGSIYPCIYAGCLKITTEEKIESLKNEYSNSLRYYFNDSNNKID